jgi:D-alanyl-D-alanine carboxypeptidase
MTSLIEAHVSDAAVKRTVPRIGEIAEAPATNKKVRVAEAAPAKNERAKAEPAKTDAAARAETTAAIPVPRPSPGSTDPIKPRLVKTLTVKPGATQLASAGPLSLLSPQLVTSQAGAFPSRADTALPPPPPGARPGVLGVLPASAADPSDTKATIQLAAAEAKHVPAPPVPASREARLHSGWIIQVGAFDDEAEARQRLASAQNKAGKLLGGADPFTEPVAKGDKTLYRARFAGLKQSEAEAACKHLKRNDIVCMTVRN